MRAAYRVHLVLLFLAQDGPAERKSHNTNLVFRQHGIFSASQQFFRGSATESDTEDRAQFFTSLARQICFGVAFFFFFCDRQKRLNGWMDQTFLAR